MTVYDGMIEDVAGETTVAKVEDNSVIESVKDNADSDNDEHEAMVESFEVLNIELCYRDKNRHLNN